MTDKQIIIDGVDVSNCKYKLEEQFKAKEQECEKLKAEVKKQKEIAKEYEQRWLSSYGV